MKREYKRSEIWVKGLDEDQGIVEAIVSVFGNIDYQGDIVEPGAFAKTITERGFEVQVLDNHQSERGGDIVGTIVALREVGPDQLPSKLLETHPEATGGLLATVQFLMGEDTPEGRGIFARIKAGAIRQYSIGYDAINPEPDIVQVAGQDITVRRLKEIRLWEISPVIFAANDATRTVSAKGTDSADAESDTDVHDVFDDAFFDALKDNVLNAEPSEGKPWDVFAEGGEFCVYQIDEDGKQIEKVSCHDSRDAAEAHMRALYANVPEDEDGKGAQEVEEVPILELGDAWKAFIRKIAREEITQALSAPAISTEVAGAGPNEAPPTSDKGAGPDTEPPTSDVLADVEQAMLDLNVLELRALEVSDADLS